MEHLVIFATSSYNDLNIKSGAFAPGNLGGHPRCLLAKQGCGSDGTTKCPSL